MDASDIKKILVVEDDGHIAEGLNLNLSLQGYDVAIASDGIAAIDKWEQWHPDLIVLDIMLPHLDGLSVLQRIRSEDAQLPILILSAKSASDDRIRGLAYGVDDYLSKPFNLDEFLLRVERLLTRASWYRPKLESQTPGDATENVPTVYSFGQNRIDFTTYTGYAKNGAFSLTDQEIKLLQLFIANRGKPLSRETILEIGWGYAHPPSTRTVDNFIVRFRKYFEDDPKNPAYFRSLRSVGYIFDHN
jgi:two-component system, OmpR family, alkaline phosphatase synthesis response regulator PhoP